MVMTLRKLCVVEVGHHFASSEPALPLESIKVISCSEQHDSTGFRSTYLEKPVGPPTFPSETVQFCFEILCIKHRIITHFVSTPPNQTESLLRKRNQDIYTHVQTHTHTQRATSTHAHTLSLSLTYTHTHTHTHTHT